MDDSTLDAEWDAADASLDAEWDSAGDSSTRSWFDTAADAGDTALGAVASATVGFGSGISNIGEAVTDLPYIRDIPGAQSANRFFDETSRMAGPIKERIENEIGVDTTAEKILFRGVSSAGEMAPWLTLGPGGLIGGMSTVAGTSRYNEAREKGFTRDKAAAQGVAKAAIAALVERLPANEIFAQGRGFLRQTLGSAFGEGVEETVEAVADDVLDAVSSGNLQEASDILQRGLMTREGLTEKAIAGATGAVGGAAAGGTFNRMQARQEAQEQNALKEIEDEIEQRAKKIQESQESKETTETAKPILKDIQETVKPQPGESELLDDSEFIEDEGAADTFQFSEETDEETAQTDEIYDQQGEGTDVPPIEESGLDLEEAFEDEITPEAQPQAQAQQVQQAPTEQLTDEFDNASAGQMVNEFAQAANLNSREFDERFDRVGDSGTGARPAWEVPVNQIKLSKDVQQFKEGSDPRTGVVIGEELAGDIVDEGFSPIILWQRENGDLEVITGRHRLDLFRRNGRKTIPSQILREADGVTKDVALSIDAEQNIINNNGSVADFARYFRDKQFNEQEATKRGLLRPGDHKGRKGYSIGMHASPALYEMYRKKRITDGKAAAISEAAPNNQVIQRAAVRQTKGKSVEYTKHFTKQLAMAEKDGDLQIQDAEQGVMFADDPAVKLADDITQNIIRQKRDIRRRINALKVNPEVLQDETGATVKLTPEQAADKIRDYQQLLEKIDKRDAFPKVQSWIKSGNPLPKRWTNEFGGFNFHNDPVFQKIPNAIRDVFYPEGPGGEAPSAGNQFGEGRMGKFIGDVAARHPVLSKIVVAPYRKWVVMPRTLAHKFPELFAPVYNAARKIEKRLHSNVAKFSPVTAPYFNLKDKRKVNHELVMQRLMHVQKDVELDESTEGLRERGLDDAEIRAYQAVRQAMQLSTQMIRDALINDPPEGAFLNEGTMDAYRLNVEEIISDMEDSFYVPFSRFGTLYVHVPDYNNGQGWFSLHEDTAKGRAEKRQTIERLRKEGYKSPKHGVMNRPPADAYANMSPDLVSRLAAADDGAVEAMEQALNIKRSNRAQIQEFQRHLVEASLMPGYKTDLDRSIADYIASISTWHAQKVGNQDFREAGLPHYAFERKNIDERWEQNKWLYDYGQRYKDYVQRYTPENGKLRQFYATWYLSRVASAGINLTQTFTTTIPELTKYTGFAKAHTTVAKAYKKWSEWKFGDRAKFAKKYPELAKDLQEGIETGIVADEMTAELSARRKGLNANRRISDWILTPFSEAEQLNRVVAYIAAHDIATEQKMSPEQRVEFSEKLVEDTQYVYNKTNRPEAFRGNVRAALGTFRMFQGSWQRQLRNNMTKENYPAALYMLTTMGALGGGTALPIAKEILKAFEMAGEDPKKSVREWAPNNTWADILLYGLPTLAGINISGNIAFQELAPDIEQGLGGAAIRLATGVVGDLPQRAARAYHYWNELGHDSLVKKNKHGYPQLGRAVETLLLPPQLRTLHEAYRFGTDGTVKDARNRELLLGHETLKPTPYEIAVRGLLSLTPSRVGQAYEQRHSTFLRERRAKDNRNMNHKISQALEQGNVAKARQYVEEVLEYNKTAEPHKVIKLNDSAISRIYDEMSIAQLQGLRKNPRDSKGRALNQEEFDLRNLHSRP